MQLTSDDDVAVVINFGTVVDMTDIVWLHSVPLNFKPKIKINLSTRIARATMVLKTKYY